MKKANSSSIKEGLHYAQLWADAYPGHAALIAAELENYYCTQGRDFPWRQTTQAYEILVAEILLQKTTAKAAVQVWQHFIAQYPTIQKLAAGSLEEIRQLIRPLGLPRRAELLHQTAKYLVATTGGDLIADAAFLKSLPGIGDYTAAAILSFAFGKEAAIIDGNAVRVYTRIVGFLPNGYWQGFYLARDIAERVVRDGNHRAINYGLLDLAAEVCRPIPNCEACPLLKVCNFGQDKSLKSRTI